MLLHSNVFLKLQVGDIFGGMHISKDKGKRRRHNESDMNQGWEARTSCCERLRDESLKLEAWGFCEG